MENQLRLIIALPPGATVQFGVGGGRFSLPLWFYWVKIARQQAALAKERRPSDEMIDALSANLAGEERERPEEDGRESHQETFAAMVAVTAAAFSIDAFYGAVKPLVNPPKSKAARERQVLECLKLGFKVGRYVKHWQAELDWLFEIRDNAVHHSEEFEGTVVVRTTDETVVAGGPESFNFSAESAERAASFASELIQTCLEKPKPTTHDWAARHNERSHD